MCLDGEVCQILTSSSGEFRENYTKTGATGGQTWADGNV